MGEDFTPDLSVGSGFVVDCLALDRGQGNLKDWRGHCEELAFLAGFEIRPLKPLACCSHQTSNLVNVKFCEMPITNTDEGEQLNILEALDNRIRCCTVCFGSDERNEDSSRKG